MSYLSEGGEHFLGMILAYHVIFEDVADFLRLWTSWVVESAVEP